MQLQLKLSLLEPQVGVFSPSFYAELKSYNKKSAL